MPTVAPVTPRPVPSGLSSPSFGKDAALIVELAAMLMTVSAAPQAAPTMPSTKAGCGIAACASSSLEGRWTFAARGSRWTVDVAADGHIHAEGERSITIGRDVATYRSTLDGTLTEEGVTLSIVSDNFSAPNFVAGPPTICTGTAIGMERYRGTCASERNRMEFMFTRGE